jgi:hypothetical protein
VFILIIGKNKKLGLTGRPSGEIGLLATSKLYVMNEQMLAFIPQVKIIFEFFSPPTEIYVKGCFLIKDLEKKNHINFYL